MSLNFKIHCLHFIKLVLFISWSSFHFKRALHVIAYAKVLDDEECNIYVCILHPEYESIFIVFARSIFSITKEIINESAIFNVKTTKTKHRTLFAFKYALTCSKSSRIHYHNNNYMGYTIRFYILFTFNLRL